MTALFLTGGRTVTYATTQPGLDPSVPATGEILTAKPGHASLLQASVALTPTTGSGGDGTYPVFSFAASSEALAYEDGSITTQKADSTYAVKAFGGPLDGPFAQLPVGAYQAQPVVEAVSGPVVAASPALPRGAGIGIRNVLTGTDGVLGLPVGSYISGMSLAWPYLALTGTIGTGAPFGITVYDLRTAQPTYQVTPAPGGAVDATQVDDAGRVTFAQLGSNHPSLAWASPADRTIHPVAGSDLCRAGAPVFAAAAGEVAGWQCGRGLVVWSLTGGQSRTVQPLGAIPVSAVAFNGTTLAYARPACTGATEIDEVDALNATAPPVSSLCPAAVAVRRLRANHHRNAVTVPVSCPVGCRLTLVLHAGATRQRQRAVLAAPGGTVAFRLPQRQPPQRTVHLLLSSASLAGRPIQHAYALNLA